MTTPEPKLELDDSWETLDNEEILRRICSAVEFRQSPEGLLVKVGHQLLKAPEDDDDSFAKAIGKILYDDFYTNPDRRQRIGRVHVDDPGLKWRFAQELATQNSSRFSWMPHCHLVKSGPQGLELDSGIETPFHVKPAFFDGPEEDGSGRMLTGPTTGTEDPHWYFAFGEQGINSKRQKLVRVYWSIHAAAAPRFLHTLVKRLNGQLVPFQLKVLNDPQMYGRADGGVLYLPEFVWIRVAPVLLELASEFEPHLQDTTPLFTRRLARGVGLAEDPGEGQSFGDTLTKTIATSIIAAHRAGSDAIFDQVTTDLKDVGYDLERLHLRPGSTRDYRLLSYQEASSWEALA
ncbi:MAG: T3SS effector HopA1 family protein [Thermoplasmatota archaeon]